MIYLDNAATTKMNNECSKIIEHYNTDEYFNASAMYGCAFNVFTKIKQTKLNFLKMLGDGGDGKIYFTSGATEANNLAIFGSTKFKQKTYLFSNGEHPSVYNCAVELKNRGFDVKFIPISKDGTVDCAVLETMLNKEVCFVSTMFVNNETGAINDIQTISQLIKKASPSAIFHVDAVQAFGKINFCVKDLGIDLCTISSHKIYGPKGVGALYVTSNKDIKQVTFGGGQEDGLRSGTYNPSSIFAFEKASELAHSNLSNNFKKIDELNKTFCKQILNFKHKPTINGKNTSPYIISLSFDNIRGETLLHLMEEEGIIIGTGSACSANKVGNRVLDAMGLSKTKIIGSIRISFNSHNTMQEIAYTAQKLEQCVEKLYSL